MNRIQAKIKSIQKEENLCLVVLETKGIEFQSIVIYDSSMENLLEPGKLIHLMFKSTEVVIITELKGKISLRNKIPGEIRTLSKGNLLSKITIDTKLGMISSVITTNAVNELSLSEGKEVIAMIKTNEIFLSQ